MAQNEDSKHLKPWLRPPKGPGPHRGRPHHKWPALVLRPAEALGCKTTSRRFARLEFKVLALSQGSSQGEGGRILGFRLRELFERGFAGSEGSWKLVVQPQFIYAEAQCRLSLFFVIHPLLKEHSLGVGS